MQLQELKQMVWDNVDDAPLDLTVMRWFDRAQARLASAVNASFPKFVTNGVFTPTFEPVFDERWHEALVAFACARYKEQEASLNEVANFQQQFDNILKEMTENYEVPLIYRSDRFTQQFTVTDNTVTTFNITKIGYDPSYGNLKVYINGLETTDFYLASDGTKSFTINPTTPLAVNDAITALWEEHYEFLEPPVPWFGSW
jgi:hypothetical protein